MTDAAAELASDPANIEAALKISRRYAKRWRKLSDEFESAAYVAIVEAASTYDQEKGATFITHMGKRTHGAMLDVLRAYMPGGYRRANREIVPNVGRLDEIGIDDESRYATWMIYDVEPIGWEIEFHDYLDDLTKGLTPAEKEVIRGTYGRASRSPFKDAADRVGLSPPRMSQVYAEAIERLIYSHT